MMDIKCVYLEELKGKRLADLKHTDLNCKLELLEKIAVKAIVRVFESVVLDSHNCHHNFAEIQTRNTNFDLHQILYHFTVSTY